MMEPDTTSTMLPKAHVGIDLADQQLLMPIFGQIHFDAYILIWTV